MFSVNTDFLLNSGLFKLHFSHSFERMNESSFMRICGCLERERWWSEVGLNRVPVFLTAACFQLLPFLSNSYADVCALNFELFAALRYLQNA